MDRYLTGTTIKTLREKLGMTQAQLANRLCVSDKTVSKWETGAGYPDITLIEPIAAALRVSVAELFSGSAVQNTNVAANMTRCSFCICPVCGNIIASTGEVSVSCHGVQLVRLEAEHVDEDHAIRVEHVEDELYVHIEHPMTKQHYISFIAAVSPDRMQLVKTYPESSAEARFKIDGVSKVYCYCNKDGLFATRR